MTPAKWHAYITAGRTLADAQDRMEEAVAAGVDFADLSALATPADEIMQAVASGDEDVARARFGDDAVDAAIRADLEEAGYDFDACRAHANGVGDGGEAVAMRRRLCSTGPRDGARELTRRLPIGAISDGALRVLADDPAEPIMRRATARLTLRDRLTGLTPSETT